VLQPFTFYGDPNWHPGILCPLYGLGLHPVDHCRRQLHHPSHLRCPRQLPPLIRSHIYVSQRNFQRVWLPVVL
jgi:hypothetical protein